MYTEGGKEKRGSSANRLDELASRLLLLATLALALSGRGRDDGADGLVEDSLEAGLSERRALHVLDSANLLDHLKALLVGNGRLLLASKLLASGGIVAEVDLGADENDGSVGAVVRHLGVPLGANVLEGRRVDDGEADEEDVRLRVGEGAKAVIVLLAGSVPEAEVDGLTIDHHVGRIVVEHGRDVLA